jgi:hypothetical protein
MARAGYVVIAVDHPRNSAREAMTPAAAILPWDRAEDLRSALAAAENDPTIGPHLDKIRVSAAGFSAGGYTALVAAGARPDPDHFYAFCAENPDDGVCRPQMEMQMTDADVNSGFARNRRRARAGGRRPCPSRSAGGIRYGSGARSDARSHQPRRDAHAGSHHARRCGRSRAAGDERACRCQGDPGSGAPTAAGSRSL